MAGEDLSVQSDFGVAFESDMLPGSRCAGLVGEVVQRPRDVDRIMGFGFNWAPPSVLVDAIGPGRTIILLDKARLPIPRCILDAATHQRALFNEPTVDRARFFTVAA